MTCKNSKDGSIEERVTCRARIALVIGLGICLSWSLPARAAPMPADLDRRVAEMTADADAADLPGDRLRIKALEGVAKGVAADRIVGVLVSIRRHMDEAAALLDAAATKKLNAKNRRRLVGSLTTALQTGVSNESLAELALLSTRDELNPMVLDGAVVALTDLVTRGYDATQSHRLIKLALEQGFEGSDFANLLQAVNTVRGRAKSDAALQAIYEAVAAGEHGTRGKSPGASGVGGAIDVQAPGATRGRGAAQRGGPNRQGKP